MNAWAVSLESGKCDFQRIYNIAGLAAILSMFYCYCSILAVIGTYVCHIWHIFEQKDFISAYFFGLSMGMCVVTDTVYAVHLCV